MLKDLTGQRFGRLSVLRRAPHNYRCPSGSCATLWVCRCECGAEVIIDRRNLTSGRTCSCGCLRRENARRQAEARRKKKEAGA